MSARTCWRVEVEFETGVRSNYEHTPEAIRDWVKRALERGDGPIVHPSDVQIISLISPKLKPTLPPSPSPTRKRTLRKKATR